MSDYPEITPEIAANVLNWYESGTGYPGGSFTTSLIRTITVADVWNRARLMGPFPGLVMAVHLAQNTPEGLDALREMMRGER